MIAIKPFLLYFLLTVVILGVYVFLEPFRIEEKNILVADSDHLEEKNNFILVNADIPQQFENTSIIFLTDIHHGPYFSEIKA